MRRFFYTIAGLTILVLAGIVFAIHGNLFPRHYTQSDDQVADASSSVPAIPPLDITAYNLKLLELAHAGTSTAATSTVGVSASGVIGGKFSAANSTTTASTTAPLWPVKTVYPDGGAIVPFKRIVAYYGNPASTAMGVLGQYPPAQMLAMLQSEVSAWQAADPTTPVQPALDYIVVVAQGSPGSDGKYRERMPTTQINEVLALAAQANAIVFLDVQDGLSTVQSEIPLLEPYLKLPNVELALDPEFSMHDGQPPGTVVGTMDATDINYAADYLAGIVRQYGIPPKILLVHRFTEAMVTNYQDITPLPEVQIVMDMDGWGPPKEKIGTYDAVIYKEPVELTGFKLFYKNDVRIAGSVMLTPAQVLNLTPSPIFIEYQ